MIKARETVATCTGITVRAKDGAVVFGRTLEWGSFDLKSRLVIVPRGYEYKSHLESGQIGKDWKTVYGAVGLDVVEKDLIQDGMNEKGLSVNVFYHPGFAEYAKFDPAKADNTLGSLDLCQYLLTTCATVTCWTTAYDTKNLVMHYHTQHNRRVRQVDMNKIDFSGSKELIRIPLDLNKSQDIEDVTPKK